MLAKIIPDGLQRDACFKLGERGGDSISVGFITWRRAFRKPGVTIKE